MIIEKNGIFYAQVPVDAVDPEIRMVAEKMFGISRAGSWLDYVEAATTQVMQHRHWYQHKVRGTAHLIIGEGRLQIGNDKLDNTLMVMYLSEDGAWWTRPVAEFHDGRFSRVGDTHVGVARESDVPHRAGSGESNPSS